MKHSPAALLAVAGLLTAVPAAAGPTQAAGPPGQAEATLVGPRRVVVWDLPPAAASATERARDAIAPRPLPPAVTVGPITPAPAANATDPAFSGEPEANTPPTTSSIAKWEGLDNSDNATLTGFIVRPPDPQLAVGPDHVFEIVNISGRIYSRTGTTVDSFSLADFFAVPSGWRNFDPKVIYDALSGRWFASYVSLIDKVGGTDEGRLHFAISQTSDPTGTWNVYYRPYTVVFPDYPGIGVTSDKFTISSNIFDIDHPLGLYFGEETIVIEKADVMAGVAGAEVGLVDFDWNTSRFTVRPAHSLTAVNDQYLVTRTSSTTLTVIRITGTPDQGNVSDPPFETNLTMTSQTTPPPSRTAGTGQCIIRGVNYGSPPCIDSGDDRMLDAVWRNGSLWTSASAACVPQGDSTTRSCAHLIEVNATPPSVPTIAQDIMFGAAGEYYSWPAVRTDASGNVYVSLTHTNTSIFAEARSAGRLASEPANTMSGSTLLRAGQVVVTGGTGGGRWGDYLAAAVDPNFPDCVWLVGQYAKSTPYTSEWDWGTYIAATSYSGGCDSDNDRMSDAYEAARPCLLPNTNDAAADPDADGFTNFIEFFVGTDPCDPCPATAAADDEDPDPWPSDFNDTQDVDGLDAFLLAQRFGSTTGSTPSGKLPYSARYDLNADAAINGLDVFPLAQSFNTSCSSV